MKKIDLIIEGCFLFYAAAFLIAGLCLKQQSQEKSREYLVEVNRILYGMEEQGCFSMPALDETEQIDRVLFLDKKEFETSEHVKEFFQRKNGLETHIEPLTADGKILGLVRFDYKAAADTGKAFRLLAGVLAISGVFLLGILLYIRNKIIKPFIVLSDMPYELAKGRLGTEIEENKNRFFGRFVWGISMLRDNLKASQMKALKLEREKKLLLLSISHDIKTPLNSIKLYAKALEEGIYDTQEKQRQAARQIDKLSGEIEGFVQKIVKSSSEEIIALEVENSEFYLKDFVKRIKEYYEQKCRFLMTELFVGSFDNRLLKGSMDAALETVENIMENAFKYGDGRRIEITFYEEEYCQLIKIRNTGQPVKAEEMPHLFDSFYRGSNAGERTGNGLGLYICRELMGKMEGEIFAVKEEDGMSFHLVFRL